MPKSKAAPQLTPEEKEDVARARRIRKRLKSISHLLLGTPRDKLAVSGKRLSAPPMTRDLDQRSDTWIGPDERYSIASDLGGAPGVDQAR